MIPQQAWDNPKASYLEFFFSNCKVHVHNNVSK